MNDLKQCPFCGSDAEMVVGHGSLTINKYVVVCKNEDCSASVGIFSKSREEAIESWNRRV